MSRITDMPKNNPIRRGALSRALSVSLAGARAGGVFAIDGALKRFRGEAAGDDARLEREARRFAQQLGTLKGSYVKIGQLFALLGEHFLPAPLTRADSLLVQRMPRRFLLRSLGSWGTARAVR